MKRFPVPRDLVIFGIVMILSGLGDLSLIISYPEYRLPVFGMKPEGVLGLLIKGVQPLIHFVSGYGIVYGRRWAYPVLMTYSAYGLINAVVNRLLLPPPHRIRTIFIIGTVLMMGYLYYRRKQFRHEGPFWARKTA